MKNMITQKEALEILGVSHETLRQIVINGGIMKYKNKINGRIRYDRKEVENLHKKLNEFTA